MSGLDIVNIFDIRRHFNTTTTTTTTTRRSGCHHHTIFRPQNTTMRPHKRGTISAVILASMATGQSADRRPSLTETLQAHNDTLSTLNSYIQTRQDLFTAINRTSDITILAPSNDALDGLFGNSAVMADFNSDPELVEAFWNYHVLRGVWWTSNLTAETGSSSSSSAARKRRKGKRDGNDVVDESGLDGQSLFIPTLLAPDITPYANVSGGQRVIARSSSSSSDGEAVVSFYSGTTGATSENVQKSTITHANFNFSGGTIHIIDHVLSLPSRLNDTLASFGPSYSSSGSSSSSSTDENDETSNLLSLTASVGALSRANLTNLFNSQRDITMFVPSNSAWNSVGSVVSNMDEDELAQIMGYHVLKGQTGKVFYSDLLESTGSDKDVDSNSSGGTSGTSGISGTEKEDEFEKDYETVEGGKVKVRVVNGSSSSSAGGNGKDDDDDDDSGSSKQVFVNGARVVKSDVLVENGVVHVVDGVLNPSNTTATPIPTASTEPVAWDGATTTNSVPFTSGVQAPTTSLGQNSGGVVTETSTITVGGPSPPAATSGTGGKAVTVAVGMMLLWGGICVFANL